VDHIDPAPPADFTNKDKEQPKKTYVSASQIVATAPAKKEASSKGATVSVDIQSLLEAARKSNADDKAALEQ